MHASVRSDTAQTSANTLHPRCPSAPPILKCFAGAPRRAMLAAARRCGSRRGRSSANFVVPVEIAFASMLLSMRALVAATAFVCALHVACFVNRAMARCGSRGSGDANATLASASLQTVHVHPFFSLSYEAKEKRAVTFPMTFFEGALNFLSVEVVSVVEVASVEVAPVVEVALVVEVASVEVASVEVEVPSVEVDAASALPALVVDVLAWFGLVRFAIFKLFASALDAGRRFGLQPLRPLGLGPGAGCDCP